MDYNYKTFDEISIGDKVKFDILIDEKSHNDFSRLSGDFSPIHCNEEFAESTIFKHRIAYAFLLNSYLSQLYGMYLPGGTSICLKQESKFIRPVYIGQKILVEAEVLSKSDSTKMLEIKTEMRNEENQKVFEGKGTVQLLFDTRNLIMFRANKQNKDIYCYDIVKGLKEGGIKENNIVLVHADVSKFGKIGDIKNKSEFLRLITDSLKEVVGENGTIIMPTFSYSFCKNEEYNPDATSSTVGVLSEHFRKGKDVVRTLHPIFSVAVWGREKEIFSENLGKDSFGKDSVFGKLHHKNGKIIFFGAPFQSCTFIHYIEQLFNVPYRYHKIFTGKIRIKNELYEDSCSYFVRSLDGNAELDLLRFQDYLIQNGLMKKVELGDGEILIISADTLFNEGVKMLKEDINFFLGTG